MLTKILVVGGAGYIGSHMVLALQEAGLTPIVLDNLSKGHADAVSEDVEFVYGNASDKEVLSAIFKAHQISAVMHFASYIEVGESVKNPLKYYQNNVAATLVLLETMLENNIKKFIFSSTAAVYGEPQYTPINEAHPIKPINPYGKSKVFVENILQDLANSHHLQFAILRYFNAAGADPKGRLRERHDPESHLIPIILQVAAGVRDSIHIYGNDYKTPDGTCIRDYIHVTDLCEAHLLALQALDQNKKNIICNLGTGQGFSVKQVIEAARAVTGHKIPAIDKERRAGDPAILVADATLANQLLKWTPKYTSLETIIEHAWQTNYAPRLVLNNSTGATLAFFKH